ncbi:MAG: ABC transporter ATP-binding protein [Geminicoccaceae bacterium]
MADVAERAAPGAPFITGSSLVELRSVSKSFANGTVALQNLDLSIGAHAFVALLGPSGCGKSTALRLIANLSQPTSGEVAWSEPPERGSIGFVFQEPTLMPWATVFDNVYLPLKLAGRPKSDVRDRIAHALSMVGLDEFANAFPRELSGGMKMRVSIARAIVTEPKVLLMDEPFAALDEITRFRLNNDLLRLWQAHSWTVIFVTHSVYESVYLAQRIVVMAARPGRVVSDIPIDTPYPRGDDFRASPAYNEACRQVSNELHRAMGEP